MTADASDPALPRTSGTLVFLPGFMTAPTSYEALLAPLQDAGVHVVVPHLYRRGIKALSGALSVADEAVRACEFLASLPAANGSGPLWLGGHSRGGQAAWRSAQLLATNNRAPTATREDAAAADGDATDADRRVAAADGDATDADRRAAAADGDATPVWEAGWRLPLSSRNFSYPRTHAEDRLPAGNRTVGRARPRQARPRQLAGLILVDPVDGSGRRPAGPEACANAASFDLPTLIIGAGIGGNCAPAAVNHDVFAAATPGADHVVVAGLGHADILCGPVRTLGRLLCGGGDDPTTARRRVSELMLAAITGPIS